MARRRGHAWFAVALCGAFVVQAWIHARSTSATYDEPPHLAAGYTYWLRNDYRLNPEHPPLVKRLAALPLLWIAPWTDAEATNRGTRSRRRVEIAWEQSLDTTDAQWVVGHELLYGIEDSTLERNGVGDSHEVDPRVALSGDAFLHDADDLLTAGRSTVIVLALLLGLLIFRWARELHGPTGAVLALALYCFDPNFIAHGSLVTTDVAAALGFCAAMYFLWRNFRDPSVANGLAFAGACGLAAATKFTLVLLAPMVVVACVVTPRPPGGWPARAGSRLGLSRTWVRVSFVATLLLVAAVTAYVAVWASYGFRFSAAADDAGRLPTEQVLRRAAATRALEEAYPDRAPPADAFREALVSAERDVFERLLLGARRFELLPEAYIHGLAHARMKSAARYSFLRGRYHAHGSPTYFVWTFLLKTPLVTLSLIAVALLFAAYRLPRVPAGAAFLLAPVLIYGLFSVGSALNIGHRHLLPIYPFLFVFCGSLAEDLDTIRPRRRRTVVLAAIVFGIAVSCSLVFSPLFRPTGVPTNYLAFFNEIAGGPKAGHLSLVDSNLDWGQDLKKLDAWLKGNGITEPINLCYFGMGDPRFHGIRHVKMPGGYALEPPFGNRARFEDARVPGWLVISATHLKGVYMSPELRAQWSRFLARAEPRGTVGRSLFVYYLPG